MSSIKKSGVVVLVGGGDLPKIIVNHFVKKNIKFFCIGFLKNPFNSYLKKFDYQIINFGKIVTTLKKLKNKGFDKLIMAGNLKRPSITDIKPDINSLKLLPSFAKKILQSGDNTLLSFAIKNLEKIGYKIINLDKIIPSLFAGKGNISKTKITNKMYLELNYFDAHIDGQYVCPHHPEWNNGNRRSIIKNCYCRKPGTLLFERAAKENNFSAHESVFIGDSSTDFEAAAKWGIISIGVLTGNSTKYSKDEVHPDYWKNDLWDAVNFLLDELK